MRTMIEARLSSLDLRGKLRILVLAAAGSALLLAGTVLVGVQIYTLRLAIRHDAVGTAEVVAANGASSLIFGDPRSARATLASLRARPRFRDAAFYDRDGKVFAKFSQLDAPPAVPAAPGPDGLSTAGRLLFVFAPVSWNGERVGTLYLSADLSDLYAGAGLFVLVAAATLLLCLAAADALGRPLQDSVSRPILELAETARAISEKKDYSLRAPSGGRDELGLLAEAFNEMLAQIHGRDAALLEAQAALEKRVAERTAQLMEQTRRLKDANAELETFNYSASHDLRAPLRGIDGFTEVLLKRHFDRLDDQARDYLQRIRDGARRMSELIDALLRLSRLGRSELRPQRVDMSDLARRIAQRLRELQPDRQVEFIIPVGVEARGDPSLLEAVLENLIDNAWKYTARRAPARIELGRTSRPDEDVFFVRDNGVGFDMAHADKLFVPFQRLHGRTEFPGTGIGLATVKRVVERHGGRVWGEGAIESGSTFYFALPRS